MNAKNPRRASATANILEAYVFPTAAVTLSRLSRLQWNSKDALLQRQVQELRFLMEEGQDGEAGEIYGPLITQAAVRIRRLQKAMSERSVAARRRGEDVAIRVPLAAE